MSSLRARATRVWRLVALGILLALPGAPSGALACSCAWAGPFTKVAPRQALIVLGEVRSHHRNSMDVAVVHVIKGIEDRPTIRIWGDNGALCRPGVNSFPARTRWLLAVSPLPETPTGDPSVRPGFGSPPGRTEYAISICGDFWLEVRGDRAIGRIAVAEHGARMESAPLPDVLAWIRSGGATPLPPHAPVR